MGGLDSKPIEDELLIDGLIEGRSLSIAEE